MSCPKTLSLFLILLCAPICPANTPLPTCIDLVVQAHAFFSPILFDRRYPFLVQNLVDALQDQWGFITRRM